MKKDQTVVSKSVAQHNSPVKKFRAGAISATVWNNKAMKDGEMQEYTTFTFERSYKDKEGNWQTTNSLRVNDLPKAMIVLQEAYKDHVLRSFDSEKASDNMEDALNAELEAESIRI